MSLMLDQLLVQEQALQFRYFDDDIAWQLGNYLHQLSYERDLSVALEVYVFDRVVFSSSRIGLTTAQGRSIPIMRNNVLSSGHSSHYLSLFYCSDFTHLSNRFVGQTAISTQHLSAMGGSFPLKLHNGPLIGAISCVGLASIDDHNLVVEALTHVISRQALID